MSLDNLSRDEINSMSMLELAREILLNEKKALDFRDIFNKIAELKEYTEAQKEEFLVQFYTDLNVDGRFITLGSNMWGLKRWYPFEQIDEDIHNEPKKKKKAKKKIEDDDDLDLDLEDDLDLDLDGDVDDLDDEDDEFEDLEDDFDDLEDDDDFDDFDDDEDEEIDDDLEDLNEIEDEDLEDDLDDEEK